MKQTEGERDQLKVEWGKVKLSGEVEWRQVKMSEDNDKSRLTETRTRIQGGP